MNLLDCLLPQSPPEPKDAKVVELGMLERPAEMVERSKKTQRKRWREQPRIEPQR